MVRSIAIVIVMVAINLFMVYAIVKTWKKVNEKVEKYFLHNASNFGPIKEEVLVKEAFEVEPKKEEKPSKSVFIQDESQTVFYQNTNFSSDYKEVKENMEFSKKEIIQDVISKGDEKSSLESIAIELLKKLDFEVVYELTTLTSENQLKVLYETLSEDEMKMVDMYLHTTNRFDIVEFNDYVKHYALNGDPTFYVKTGWKNDNFDYLGDNVKTVYDENITEGVKIVHKDKLYDYSI